MKLMLIVEEYSQSGYVYVDMNVSTYHLFLMLRCDYDQHYYHRCDG